MKNKRARCSFPKYRVPLPCRVCPSYRAPHSVSSGCCPCKDKQQYAWTRSGHVSLTSVPGQWYQSCRMHQWTLSVPADHNIDHKRENSCRVTVKNCHIFTVLADHANSALLSYYYYDNQYFGLLCIISDRPDSLLPLLTSCWVLHWQICCCGSGPISGKV